MRRLAIPFLSFFILDVKPVSTESKEEELVTQVSPLRDDLTMSLVSLPLQELAQRIDQHETELAKLRKEYAFRRTQLAQLMQRKKELQAQIQKIDIEIQAVAPAPAAAKSAKAAAPKPKLSLHEVLTQILAKSSRPLTAAELAAQVLQTGYETKSKDFKNVIWVSVGKMKNIQRVAGKGYALKKAKLAAAGKKS
jgi:DNA repair exonuclease SbcCD ATPase subunit